MNDLKKRYGKYLPVLITFLVGAALSWAVFIHGPSSQRADLRQQAAVPLPTAQPPQVAPDSQAVAAAKVVLTSKPSAKVLSTQIAQAEQFSAVNVVDSHVKMDKAAQTAAADVVVSGTLDQITKFVVAVHGNASISPAGQVRGTQPIVNVTKFQTRQNAPDSYRAVLEMSLARGN